jgi:hypothetical protein
VASELAALQRRFWRYATFPTGVAEARAVIEADDFGAAPLAAWLHYDDEDTAIERLDVYANMYFFRLRDVLAEDFAAVHAAVGPERFHNLATDYLLACPPRDPSIRNVGDRLPDFLEHHALSASRPWLADLARFEWARISVFDAADPRLLDRAALAQLRPEAWATLPIRRIAASRRLELRFPAPAQRAALLAGEPPPTEPEETSLVVWRRGFLVHHRSIVDAAERAALDRAGEGVSFAEVCGCFVRDDVEIAGAAQAAHAHLLRWLDEGILQREPEHEGDETR